MLVNNWIWMGNVCLGFIGIRSESSLTCTSNGFTRYIDSNSGSHNVHKRNSLGWRQSRNGWWKWDVDVRRTYFLIEIKLIKVMNCDVWCSFLLELYTKRWTWGTYNSIRTIHKYFVGSWNMEHVSEAFLFCFFLRTLHIQCSSEKRISISETPQNPTAHHIQICLIEYSINSPSYGSCVAFTFYYIPSMYGNRISFS